MDIDTYLFVIKTLMKETRRTNTPKEIEEIVLWLKSKGFIMRFLDNPQTNYKKEVMEGSYSVNLAYDLGEKRRQILECTILKNQWTNWKIEWWLRLDEIENNWIGKGNDLQELKEKVIKYLYIEEG